MTLMTREDNEPRVTVIIAVKNEERTIAKVLESALNLDYPDYEIILVDGGSSDRTVSIAEQRQVKIISAKDLSAGQGRNVGIEHASGEIISFLDGDCYPRKDYLKNAVQLLEQDAIGGVGGPVTSYSQAEYMPRTLLDVLSTFFANAGSTIFSKDRRRGEVKNIGGIGVYRKEAIEKAGLYSERLRFCEDVDLNYRIKAAGFRILYSPDIVVEHDWKVRSFRSLFRHMLNYGKGRAIAGRKHRYLFSPVYAIPSIALLSLLALLMMSALFGGIFLFAVVLSLSAYFILALLSALLVAFHFKDAKMIVIAPVAYAMTHAVYAIGFLQGLIGRGFG